MKILLVSNDNKVLTKGTIDLSSSLVKEKRQIKVIGRGGERYKVSIKYPFSYLSVVDDSGNKIDYKKESDSVYTIPFMKSFIVNIVYDSSSLIPLPKEINQNEQQYVLYEGNLYADTIYDTEKQTTRVILSSTKVLSLSPEGSKNSRDVSYGPFVDKKGGEYQSLRAHFANNSPFLSLKLTREIWISHWGSDITVQEWYELHNYGAKLKGSFARSQYMIDRADRGNNVKSFSIELPLNSQNVYYRDDIGNVSSSHLRYERRKTLLELQPRYPIFGGWNYTWHLGYNVELEKYLRVFDNEQYMLRFPTLKSIPGAFIEEFKLKIILPEGAKFSDIKLPFETDRQSSEITYSYIDTIGRLLMEFQKKSVVDSHSEDFEVTINSVLI